MSTDPLLQSIITSRKYRYVCADTVVRILDESRKRYSRDKEIEKAVKEKLHGITGAFMSEKEYRCAFKLAQQQDFDALLECHASTRERMPLSVCDEIFSKIIDVTGSPDSILDLACGLNPIYLKKRFPDSRILGADISGQCIEILHILGIDAIHIDLLCANPVFRQNFHTVLLFKVLPLLDRQKSGSALKLLSDIQSRFIVISFPTRTLSGRNVGMEDHYRQWMQNNLPTNRAIRSSFVCGNELFYILEETVNA